MRVRIVTISVSAAVAVMFVLTLAALAQSTGKRAEVRLMRKECAILLPERDERNDIAKLIRADEFLRCERDGFPGDLAPPGKLTLRANKS